MIISKSDLLDFFKKAQSDFDIFLPFASELEADNLSYKKFSDDTNFIVNKYRTIDPIKTLFYLPSESVLPPSANAKKRIIVGVKNCDLIASEILDVALLKDNFVEPNYRIWRENTYIISADCTDALPTCHCVLLDNDPYPEKNAEGESNFDLNLSQISNVSTSDGDNLGIIIFFERIL